MLQIIRPAKQSGRALDRNGLLALIACAVLLVIIGAASVWQAGLNGSALALAQQTRAKRETLTNILLAAQDAESAQRGYLLTRDAAYLAPFDAAQRELPGLVAQMAASDAGSERDRTVLRQVLTAKMAELAQTIDLTRRGDLDVALRLVRTNNGSQNMALIRSYVTRLGDDVDGALFTQMAAVTQGGHLLVIIDIVGFGVVLALAGLIGLGVRRYLSGLRAAQQQAAMAYTALEQSNDRLDEAVHERTAELSQANEEIQRYAYIVSHDLRSPLVNVMGFTSELEQAAAVLSGFIAQQADVPASVSEMSNVEIPEALRFIRTSTSKMDRLINAILRLSREGRRVLAPEPLDMATMLRGMADSMQTQILKGGVTVEIGAMPPLTADRLAVEQVFSNVIENAVKYLKPGRPGVVRVSGHVEAGQARFDVTDNGRGIAERDYERVFELFRRSGDQSVPGEGIGLAHVRALVRRLGGTITCQSQLDSGTTFTISLPLIGSRVMESAA